MQRFSAGVIAIPFLLCLAGSIDAQRPGQTIAPGTRVTGTFAAGDSAVQEWTFRVRRPGLVTIRAESPDFTPTLKLIRGDGAEEGGWVLRDTGYAQMMPYPAPGERYTLRVARDGRAAGAYQLSIVEGAPLGTIQEGQAVNGLLDGADPSTRESAMYHYYYYEDWAFDGSAGGSVEIRAHSASYETRVMVGVRDGDSFQQLAIARAGRPGDEARLTFVPPRAGHYVVRVGGHDWEGMAGHGTYTLALRAPLTLRAEPGAHGFLGSASELENWAVRTESTGPVTISIDSVAGTPSIEVVQLEGDRYLPIATRTGTPHVPTVLQTSLTSGRTYRIRVRGAGSGRYQLRVMGGAVVVPCAPPSRSSDATARPAP